MGGAAAEPGSGTGADAAAAGGRAGPGELGGPPGGEGGTVPAGPSWDIIVSHSVAEPDAAWARWLCWQLAHAGYRVLSHPLVDSAPPAGAAPVDLDRHLTLGGEILVIWSAAYRAQTARSVAAGTPARATVAGNAAMPGMAAVADKATMAGAPPTTRPGRDAGPPRTAGVGAGGGGRIILVRIEDCSRPAPFAGLLAFDLFGLDATLARDWLLRQVTVVAPRPATDLTPPPFPPTSFAGTDTGADGQPSPCPGDAGGHRPPGPPARGGTAGASAGATFTGAGVRRERGAARDLAAARRLAVLPEERGHPMSVSFSPTAALLATGGTDTTVRLWQAAFPDPPRLVATVGYGRRINQEWARAVTFSPDGRILAAAGDAGTTVLWQVADPARPVPLMTLTGHRGYLHDLGFSPGGTLLATAGDDRAVLLWDLAEPGVPRRAAILAGHRSAVRAVAFSPDGTLLATGAEDRTVTLWDLADPTHPSATVTLSGARGAVFSVAFSPDGDLLAVAGKDRTVRVYSVADPTTETVLVEIADHRRAVQAVAFSPDGTLLATASADRTATVRDITDPERPGPGHRLPAHAGPVQDVAFAPDSRLLATAGADRRTVLWDLFPSPPADAR
ncbi:WD40 repeat domain-containing protein [Frankia sp. ArI3]|uniref:WD40 repeat domain-containing protein n=1 Tax=Frankia sp. ArI3 TaxID=1858 RepID=UPI001C6FCAAC|nr:WD40 repeat domain-containing protein [Frankia sp. ArI3]